MPRKILAVTLLILGVWAMPALAGKGGNGTYVTPSCWWDPAQSAGCPDGGKLLTNGPVVGNDITFDFKTNYYDATNGTGPWLEMQCFRSGDDYQYEGQLSGVMILSVANAGFAGGWGYGDPFPLTGTSWHLGPADCTIQVGHTSKSGKFMVDASNTFSVSG